MPPITPPYLPLAIVVGRAVLAHRLTAGAAVVVLLPDFDALATHAAAAQQHGTCCDP